MGSIIRIDKPKNSTKGTHGWQVRVNTHKGKKYHSRLFSDRKCGGRDEALAEAKEYLKTYLEEHPELAHPKKPANNPFLKGKLSARNKSGVNGVFRTYQYFNWDKERRRRYYWAASCPTGPDGKYFAKRFYVETYGEEVAKQLAIEFRKMWEEAVEQGEEALKEFFIREHYDKIGLPADELYRG